MKRFLKRLVFLAAVVIASGCATTAQNGPNANDANIMAGAQTAYVVGKGLYDAGKLTDDEAEAVVLALQSVVSYVKAARGAAAAGDKAGEAAYLRAAADALDALTARLAAKKG